MNYDSSEDEFEFLDFLGEIPQEDASEDLNLESEPGYKFDSTEELLDEGREPLEDDSELHPGSWTRSCKVAV